MKKFISNGANETKKIAAILAKNAKSNIFALSGELGAGKTVFVQGFAKGLGVKDKIISPTFVLIREHKIQKSEKILYHIDLYRLGKSEELRKLGIEDLFSNPDNIILIEWAEKLKKLPENTVKITIKRVSAQKRLITIN